MKTEARKKALAKYLRVEPGDLVVSDWDSNLFINGDEEYLVLTEDETYDYIKEYTENLMDELGLDSFIPSFQDWIIDYAIDEFDFNEYYSEFTDCYIDGIKQEPSSEGYENRLIDEMVDNGLLDDDDFEEIDGVKCVVTKKGDYLKEIYKDYLMDTLEDPVRQYESDFGKEELYRFAKESNSIDIDKIVDGCISLDGTAHFLAGYDGEEIELDNDLFAYRTN